MNDNVRVSFTEWTDKTPYPRADFAPISHMIGNGRTKFNNKYHRQEFSSVITRNINAIV